MGKVLGGYLMPHPPVIIPEIGRGRESEIHNTIEAMNKIAEDISAKKPDTIIIISPHGTLFKDAISIMGSSILMGDLREFGTSHIGIEKENNLFLAKEIDARGWNEGVPTILLDDEKAKEYQINLQLDHGALVPLYFVENKYKSYNLVHITYGLLPREQLYLFGHIMADCIRNSDFDAVIIASGDLSHKLTEEAPAGFHPNGKAFDDMLLSLLKEGDAEGILSIDSTFAKTAGECGLRSIDIMLGAFDGYEISVETLSYEGPFGVGYATAIIYPGNKEGGICINNKLDEIKDERIRKIRDKEDEYVRLARKALEQYIRNKEKIDITHNANSDILHKKAGVFVSLKKDGELRGCIGTIEPTEENVGKEIIKNAILSGTQDPRFYPVEKWELDDLVYSVDILESPEPIDNISQLDPKKYGVVVQRGGRKGLLLPNLEGVNTIEQQIDIALQKANIKKSEKYQLYRFKVERHK